MNWQQYFQALVKTVAAKSKDSSTKVGAVIFYNDNSICSTGYNGFPRGVKDNVADRNERPEKYLYTVHAEANAILTAAKKGHCTEGTNMIVTTFPCAACAGMIVQAGIDMVLTPAPDPAMIERWGESFFAARTMLQEAGVTVIYLKEEENV